jgi:hypothetical protein
VALLLHHGIGKRTWLAGVACALALGWGSVAGAATLTLGLNFEFSGGTTPGGTPPFVTATFDDSFGGPNDVRLTMSTSGLVGAESVKDWWFNFDPTLNAALLVFTAVNNSASVPNSVTGGNNMFMSDGSGSYDILFDFPPPPGSSTVRFTAGETIVYDLTYISPIDVTDFNFPSTGGANGAYISAAQVQRIAPSNSSGHIGVIPEPATGLLLGLGLAGLAAAGRRSR